MGSYQPGYKHLRKAGFRASGTYLTRPEKWCKTSLDDSFQSRVDTGTDPPVDVHGFEGRSKGLGF